MFDASHSVCVSFISDLWARLRISNVQCVCVFTVLDGVPSSPGALGFPTILGVLEFNFITFKYLQSFKVLSWLLWPMVTLYVLSVTV